MCFGIHLQIITDFHFLHFWHWWMCFGIHLHIIAVFLFLYLIMEKKEFKFQQYLNFNLVKKQRRSEYLSYLKEILSQEYFHHLAHIPQLLMNFYYFPTLTTSKDYLIFLMFQDPFLIHLKYILMILYFTMIIKLMKQPMNWY